MDRKTKEQIEAVLESLHGTAPESIFEKYGINEEEMRLLKKKFIISGSKGLYYSDYTDMTAAEKATKKRQASVLISVIIASFVFIIVLFAFAHIMNGLIFTFLLSIIASMIAWALGEVIKLCFGENPLVNAFVNVFVFVVSVFKYSSYLPNSLNNNGLTQIEKSPEKGAVSGPPRQSFLPRGGSTLPPPE